MSATPDEGHCPTCKCTSLLNRRGQCVWCSTQVAMKPATRSKAGANKNRGVPICMSDDVLEQAHRLHMTGRSLNSIAKELVSETGYSSWQAMVMGLSTQFKHRGWYVRPRIEATVKASTKHGMARRGRRNNAYRAMLRRKHGLVRDVQCSGVRLSYPHKGDRCQLMARAGSDYCRFHDPALRDEVVAVVTKARMARGAA